MKIKIAALLLIMLVGCSKADEEKGIVVDPKWITIYNTSNACPNESPRGTVIMDHVYGSTTFKQFADCLVMAKERMRIEGWNEYHKETLDCEDFAMRLASGVKFEYATRYKCNDLGIPVGVAAYDVNGDPEKGHAVIYVIIDGKRVYFEPYPWSPNTALHMNKKELKTIRTYYF